MSCFSLSRSSSLHDPVHDHYCSLTAREEDEAGNSCARLANLVRCIVLIMLVAAFDADILGTMLHPGSGVATFLLGLVVLMAAERWILPPREASA